MAIDISQQSLTLHEKAKGKLATLVVTPVTTREELSLVYTPGVGAVSMGIAKDINLIEKYTIKSHTIGIITDGSAVLGLGNIGPEAALPVMEGKAVLFKTFANLDAFPICLATQEVDEIIKTVKYIAPVFGGINLEDISAPRCFAVEQALQGLGIPVMHDDQHGTAVVCLAGLINAAKVAGKNFSDLQIVVNGAGAAGNAIVKILTNQVGNIIVLDSKGIIASDRTDLDSYKQDLRKITNKHDVKGDLSEALKNSDVFIGVSKPGVLLPEQIKLMVDKPVVFALANPVPEIMPNLAKQGGAYIIATGRSDFPNQINNSLAFPGIFKGALNAKADKITLQMKIAAANAIAGLVQNPTVDQIIPNPFTPNLTETVALAVQKAV